MSVFVVLWFMVWQSAQIGRNRLRHACTAQGVFTRPQPRDSSATQDQMARQAKALIEKLSASWLIRLPSWPKLPWRPRPRIGAGQGQP